LQAIRDWPGTLSRLSGLTAPTLVIHGETDRLVPPENGRMLARAIADARLVMLANASHILFTDQFEPARDALLTFLGAQSASNVTR
jgi:pimeloyl-ACP methyl ester carboxylesterase